MARPRRRRLVLAALLVVAVTAAHLGALGAWPSAPAPAARASPPPSAPMQVRALTIAAPAMPPVAAPTAPLAAAATPATLQSPAGVAAAAPTASNDGGPASAGDRRATGATRAPTVVVRTAAGATTPRAAEATPPTTPLDAATVAPTTTVVDTGEPPVPVSPVEAQPAHDTILAQAAPAALPVAGDPGFGTPLYPTRLPPAFRWSYHLQRGLLAGTGVLDWQPTADRYRLSLTGSVAGVTLLEWISQGGFDRAGVAPLRFTVSSRGRAAQAANFQRGAGKITYSASTAEQPLPAGAQDRLSWLVQLSAVVAADPVRHGKAGASIALPVTGTRGDLGVWTFEVLGVQPVDTPFGRIEALALRRNERHAFDTRGEVWLDAQHHHLPVQVRLSTIDGRGQVADALVLRLEAIDR